MADTFSLHGRHVLVTGGTRGIGRAISLEFARAGARVLANYVRNDEAAEQLREEAGREGLAIDICRGDLTGKKGLQTIAEAMRTAGDDLVPGIVHCAATGVHRPLPELTGRHFDFTFALNVRAFFELVHDLLPLLREGSSVIVISSEGAVRAVPAYTVVGSSKGALESLARHMAAELAPRGIRVNVISPGSVRTDAWNALPDREERLEAARQRAPTGRLTTPEEVALTARFLASDAGAGIVGHTLVVDGGKRIVE